MAKHRKSGKGGTKSSGSFKNSAPVGASPTNVTPNQTVTPTTTNNAPTATRKTPLTLREIFFLDRKGFRLIVTVMVIGSIFGFLLGSGAFRSNTPPAEAADSNSETSVFGFLAAVWKGHRHFILTPNGIIVDNPHDPRYFAVLREAVVREKGGYVHPDLGTLAPAPSGSVRGLGMVRDTYRQCQSACFPGSDHERDEYRRDSKVGNISTTEIGSYNQEDILIRVPLKFQMTRQVAISALFTKLPADIQRKFLELDDAAILVLLLAHERGVGRFSRWFPYIASLPPHPSCGYLRANRQPMLNAIAVYREELGVDTEGWEDELVKATVYSESIVDALTADYGRFLSRPKRVTARENIEWALCQVASRATAGSEKYGSLRMVPVVDMINHHLTAGGFLELNGQERRDKGDPCDATEDDSGTFIVRSLRHGRRKPLRKGQELMANYNVPHYSALDWLVSLGFVPEERWERWTKLDPALPPLRRDGPSSHGGPPTEQLIRERDEKVLARLQELDL